MDLGLDIYAVFLVVVERFAVATAVIVKAS